MRTRRAPTVLVLAVCACLCLPLTAQKKGGQRKADPGPQPRVVAAPPGKAPADAVVLFDGRDMSAWTTADGGPARCEVANGEMSCRSGVGDIYSREKFGSAQIHVEFNVPHMPEHTGQMRGNSGVYVQSCFEIQILDSHNNPTYPNGSCGAVYGFAPPLVNASRAPGEWQSYDIVYRAPMCDAAGAVTSPGSITVLHNDVLVQNGLKIDKKGPGCRPATACEPAGLQLQDHSGFPNAPVTVMRFRNIWARRLE